MRRRYLICMFVDYSVADHVESLSYICLYMRVMVDWSNCQCKFLPWPLSNLNENYAAVSSAKTPKSS